MVRVGEGELSAERHCFRVADMLVERLCRSLGIINNLTNTACRFTFVGPYISLRAEDPELPKTNDQP